MHYLNHKYTKVALAYLESLDEPDQLTYNDIKTRIKKTKDVKRREALKHLIPGLTDIYSKKIERELAKHLTLKELIELDRNGWAIEGFNKR